MNVRKVSILLLFSVIILSCNTEKGTFEDLQNNPQLEYSFVKIEFLNSDQSEKSEQYGSNSIIKYSNGTSITQTYTYDPSNELYETSQFSGIDSSVINHIINSPVIAVPVNIDNIVYLGEAKWPISNNTEKQVSNLNLEKSFSIGPNTKMALEIRLCYRKVSTNIRLTLIDNKEKKEHVFDGKWVGVYPINVKIETTYTDI